MQKAYGYLTNPLTKVIYDAYGVPGLAVYEKNKANFTELHEKLRDITSMSRSSFPVNHNMFE